jgi:trehalose/maltose transport system permease protein
MIRRSKWRSVRFGIQVALVVAFALFPFYWAIVTSMRTGSELFSAHLLPSALKFENYRSVLAEKGFLQSVWNSLLVASTATGLALLLSLLASYSLGRVTFRGRSLLLVTILSVSMFPQVAVLSGMFELIRWLGLYNTLSGLSICYLLLVVPFTVWVLTSFMKALPKELEEAAALDGCGPVRTLFQVFLPLLKPALATTGILAFIAAWNEFLFALTFTLSSDKRTIPVAIANLSGASQYDLPWGQIMAASVLVTLPLVALVLAFQRQIVAGLTSGAVKG